MKLTVKTVILKDLVNKAIKGSTNNKMIPLTGFLSIELEGGRLGVTSSDAISFFSVYADDVTGENFNVVVKGDLFSKIVSKTSSETITLDLDTNTKILSFKGNGNYKIELPLDEEGELIKFPKTNLNGDAKFNGTIKLSTIKSAILANRPSLAITAEAPFLMNYLCTPDSIISADSYNICINSAKTFTHNVLVSPITFDLLSMFTADDINYSATDKAVIFESPNMKLFSKFALGIDEYPIEAIAKYGDIEYPSACAVSKNALINIVDRLSLFINEYDVNGVRFTFTQEGIQITSTNNSATELLPYLDSNNFESFTCVVGVDTIKKQVQARSGDVVKIEYGMANALKLVDNNIVQIVGLLEDSE